MKNNIIIIHTDQQRFDSLTCNGNPHANTKHIDSLAREGANFTRHVACNPVCMPSRASLLTGLTIPGHGVSSNGIPLWRRDNGCEDKNNKVGKKLFGVEVADKIPTIADILSEQGYHTSLFGKLHLEPHLSDESYGFYESYEAWEKAEIEHKTTPYYGFQKYKLLMGHGEAPCQYNKGHYGRWLHDNHPDVVDALLNNTEFKDEEDVIRKDIYKSVVHSDLHHTMWLTDEVCNHLEENKESADPNFIFVGFPDPHVPFTPPYDIAQKFADISVPGMANVDDIKTEKPAYIAELISRFNAEKKDIEQAYRYTTASVHLIDLAVGRIIDKLKEQGIYDDSIIVFTSDHGDFLGDFDMLTKFDAPFHNLLHVPFILKPQQGVKVDKVITKPMSNADVVPTLLNLAGIDIPKHIQGVDILDSDLAGHKPFVTCFTATGQNRSLTLYDNNFRYSYYLDTGEQELYNHETDYQETENLASYDEYRSKCAAYKNESFEKYVINDSGIYNHYSLW